MKRRHRSGLTGVELAIALNALDKLAKKAREEIQPNALVNEGGEPDSEVNEGVGPEFDEKEEVTVLGQIEELMAVLQARADGPPSYTFSEVHEELLDNMNIQYSGALQLKDDAAERGVKTDSIGSDSLWSATHLFDHLHFLQQLVPRCNEAASRLWINAFFYRVSTMIPTDRKMGLSLEQVVPSVILPDKSLHTVSGFVDYTAVVMPPANFSAFLNRPVLRPDDSVLVVSEAKDYTVSLKKHVPQAVTEMLGCARRTGKKTIRGVVTEGQSWIFLVLTLHDDGSGTYVQSSGINPYKYDRPSQEGVSLISAILAHWIIHSHEAFDSDTDFFLGPM